MTEKHFKALSFQDTKELAQKVCRSIGFGQPHGCRVELILEVIYWKTLNGLERPTKADRFGICQLDSEAVRSVRCNKFNNQELDKAIKKLSRLFYVDLIDTKPEELENSPMLSICFLALATVRIEESIPRLRKDRAKYAIKYSKTPACNAEERRYMARCDLMDQDGNK